MKKGGLLDLEIRGLAGNPQAEFCVTAAEAVGVERPVAHLHGRPRRPTLQFVAAVIGAHLELERGQLQPVQPGETKAPELRRLTEIEALGFQLARGGRSK